METDTDSLYIAFARETIDDCVNPELLKELDVEKWNFFFHLKTKKQWWFFVDI